MVSLHQLLKTMIERGASDLHITTGSPPQLRIDGRLAPVKTAPLTPAETKQLCYSILTEAQKAKFEGNNELDLSFGVKGLSRFRANVFMQRGAVAGTFRSIPFKIMSIQELGLPPVVAELARKKQGLVLVTGPTGSGKTTTLASLIDMINTERNAHIITVEDPIEYLHPHKNCLVNQREVGSDTTNFADALRYILRQDPDVVLIGEIRDLETVEATLGIAETGHLVFATLHTNSAVQTITRIVDMFPPHQQDQVRAQLSFVLTGVMTQSLIPRSSGVGRVLALEVLVPNPAIRSLIREDKLHQVYGQMQVGQERFSMQTMNQALYKLYKQRAITLDDAMAYSRDVDELKNLIAGRAEGIQARR